MPNIQDDQNLRALKKLARTQAKGVRVELYDQATHHWHESISHSVLKIVDKEINFRRRHVGSSKMSFKIVYLVVATILRRLIKKI